MNLDKVEHVILCSNLANLELVSLQVKHQLMDKPALDDERKPSQSNSSENMAILLDD
jgi:hypothetical protein